MTGSGLTVAAVSPATGGVASAAGGVASAAGGGYADPDLIVLIFLLGFCLLYALVLAVGALAERDRTAPDGGSDSVSERP
ncbi:hypothetical protein [Natronomonas sp. LN261]|jgi:hypothetical protein|uniref:hypothetical protein n=1 Tax=Natronomonas sp. LN261 TaxID=2750669 RepID=UPI0015EF3B4F|nr:hypothetical protein [Natronomonas sp. LN261]